MPFEKAKCYARTGEEDTHVQIMVTEMLAYMNEISDHIYNLLLQSFQPTCQSLTAKIEEDVVHENNPEKVKYPLTKVQAALVKWARLTPVIGYSSGSYDLNYLKHWVFPLSNAATTRLGLLK